VVVMVEDVVVVVVEEREMSGSLFRIRRKFFAIESSKCFV